jgi:hypothetical protein
VHGTLPTHLQSAERHIIEEEPPGHLFAFDKRIFVDSSPKFLQAPKLHSRTLCSNVD